MKKFVPLLLSALSSVAIAQSSVASPAAEDTLTPVKPTELTAPIEALTPVQIKKMQDKLRDWPALNRYRAENATLAAPAPGETRVVFLGDSITDAWGRHHGKFFPGKPYINRGISGQTTPQMLVRFQQDVVALKPAVVVILAGTNDVAENTGPEPLSAVIDNLRSMVEIARVNRIRVVISSVLPATRFNWHQGIEPAEKIKELNHMIESFVAAEHLVYLNYYPALVNDVGGMKKELSNDGYVHPNDAGYAVMEPLAERAITEAMRHPAP